MASSPVSRRGALVRLAGLGTLTSLAPIASGALGGSLAGCSRKVPRVPTRPAPGSSTKALGGEPNGEILDTDDGPVDFSGLDPQQGPMTAHCVVVVFSDFQCPFCKDLADVLRRIRDETPKEVRIVFKHLPITLMHSYAQYAAIISQVIFLEAGSDAFWRFHDRAFAHQRELDERVIDAWARDEGILAEGIVKRRAEAERRVAQDISLSERLGLHGTPHSFVNARSIRGAYPYEQMREWVDEEL